MPSASYRRWRTVRAAALNDIEVAHALVGGSDRGHRVALQQVTRAYAVLLSAEFQGFCRELHRECADAIKAVTPAAVQAVIERQFLYNRLLDRGNPNPGNVGSDFNRLGIDFWPEIKRVFTEVASWRGDLDGLNAWRNAIAHHDYDRARLGDTIILRAALVRRWRRSCGRLARAFDRVMRDHLHTLTGTLPWP